ncbi:DCC1-like thiol-disulfide oxidoreductase family protein [Halomonas sp. YLGW01]|uniref:thiol-disulfide oxidoreductase DCC family protein n=1 Tax=Halomonas sp. YLGW01 TaxID=2773308 RepID=UPI00177EC933|nr:DCC1-like thiol-disulfide oxidoreductase family protein [Halomonas sp. YLGW01]
MTTSYTDNLLIYDGQCPFCCRYVRWLRLRESVGEIRLVDARGDDPAIDEVRAFGLDLDRGMAFRLDGQWYHGAEALRVLALLSSPLGVFNRCNRRLFGGRARARGWYPLLRGLRRVALLLLRRPTLSGTRPGRSGSPCLGGEEER